MRGAVTRPSRLAKTSPACISPAVLKFHRLVAVCCIGCARTSPLRRVIPPPCVLPPQDAECDEAGDADRNINRRGDRERLCSRDHPCCGLGPTSPSAAEVATSCWLGAGRVWLQDLSSQERGAQLRRERSIHAGPKLRKMSGATVGRSHSCKVACSVGAGQQLSRCPTSTRTCKVSLRVRSRQTADLCQIGSWDGR